MPREWTISRGISCFTDTHVVRYRVKYRALQTHVRSKHPGRLDLTNADDTSKHRLIPKWFSLKLKPVKRDNWMMDVDGGWDDGWGGDDGCGWGVG